MLGDKKRESVKIRREAWSEECINKKENEDTVKQDAKCILFFLVPQKGQGIFSLGRGIFKNPPAPAGLYIDLTFSRFRI